MPSFEILFLLLVANGAPILLAKALGERFAWPVDLGICCRDGRPLLGPSKTWRGLFAALGLSGPAALLLGLPLSLGILVGVSAMAGDLFSSWLKRRLRIRSSGMALGLDQVPEALFPLLAVRGELGLGFGEIAWLVILFVILDIVLSQLLYRLRIRSQPH